MSEMCGDNRFEIIEKAKQDILESTNIATSLEEMKVLDRFLFRCWQMGWLKQYELPFKVGDTVWVDDYMWGVIPCVVDRPYHCRCGEEGGCTFEMCFNDDDIGMYVFETKEQAEKMRKRATGKED